MAFNPRDPAQKAAFFDWTIFTFIPQLCQIIGPPGLKPFDFDKILDQYSSIIRTPFRLGRGVSDDFHGLEEMRLGFPLMTAETYLNTEHDTSIGPFEVREKIGEKTRDVHVGCIKKVGEVEKLIAVWTFVRKME